MNRLIFKFALIFLLICPHFLANVFSQTNKMAVVSGKLNLDNSWSSTLYLSHISSFEEIYLMSNKMIIAETVIDSLGNFQFQLDYLPKGENLYRLHVVKKEDSPATLIIGGKDENHLFLILKSTSNIQLSNSAYQSPFRKISYKSSPENTAFQQITEIVYKADSIASESSASKRSLIESKLYQDLKLIADTSTNFLVSQYAIHKNPKLLTYSSNEAFYNRYYSKWKKQTGNYFKVFEKKIPIQQKESNYGWVIFLVFVTIVILLVLLKTNVLKPNRIKNLTLQERKIFELLKEGASNQEISDNLNIGLSTVKSHATSIYSKLKVKSRKDIVNMK